jgi:hypothetical protein
MFDLAKDGLERSRGSAQSPLSGWMARWDGGNVALMAQFGDCPTRAPAVRRVRPRRRMH